MLVKIVKVTTVKDLVKMGKLGTRRLLFSAHAVFSFLWLWTIPLISGGKGREDPRSPTYQHLPDCGDYAPIHKQTNRTAGVCVMIKDEEGFLSEFVAFYIVQGVEYLIFYDDNSTDHSLEELQPWVEAGYATIKKAATWDGWRSPEFAQTWGTFYQLYSIDLIHILISIMSNTRVS